MLAIVYAPDSSNSLQLGPVPEPEPADDELVMAVRATSLNFGEVTFMAERQQAGHVAGNDAAGVVLRAAADGSGPPIGTRVAGFSPAGAWAERLAVGTSQLTVLPDSVDLASAAALPTAATTALRAVEKLGPILGRRVLVTGASGGVGRFAVQLAALAGAHVVAAVGRPERGVGLLDLGAAEVVVSLEDLAAVDGVLDNVGGPLLTRAFGLLQSGGLLLSVGSASLESSTVDFEAQRLRARGTRIEAFSAGSHPVDNDLQRLVALLAGGRLDPQIGWRGDWTRILEAIEALRGRLVAGKAVLDVSASDC